MEKPDYIKVRPYANAMVIPRSYYKPTNFLLGIEFMCRIASAL
jgi:hypothetical protein